MEIILSAAGLIIAFVVGYFTVVPVLDKTRSRFHELGPSIQAGRCSILSASGQYTAFIKLHNLGKGSAYDLEITLDGCIAKISLPVVHSLRPGHNEYEVTLELGKDSPVRTHKMEDACLRIIYKDRWGYIDDLSYPITQTLRADGRFNIQVHTEKPKLKRPTVSFIKMRRHLSDGP